MQLDLIIQNATGLHARPARVFVDLAKQFQSAVHVSNGTKRVNGKSLIALLSLGVTHGQAIQIEVSGADEETAAAALSDAVRGGLGEGGEAELSTPPPPASPAVPPVRPPENGSAGQVLCGVAGAPGVAAGPIFRYERARIEVRERFAGVGQEQARLDAALEQAHQQIVTLREQLLLRANPAEAAIFDVHRDLLADPELLAGVARAITGGASAAEAWRDQIEAQAGQMARLADPLLAERAADLRDVGERVLRLLTAGPAATVALPDEPVIVVAYDLTPSETAALDPQRVLGFCTAVGGPNAHTAILARALGLPAVVSAGPALLEIPSGAMAILDGAAGTLRIDPDTKAVEAAHTARLREGERRAEALRSAAEPARTSDGHRVEVAANIGGLADAQAALACGAESVGLLRTEFLFLERTVAPSEDEQYAVYSQIARALDGRSAIVRTLDIGGDKPLPYLDLPAEDNPFLGERGIRLCLAHPELLRQQLRAILRADQHGPLQIMFPMVADLEELRAARALLEEQRALLDAPPVEIGIMVEVPSAALMADLLAPEVDFFSIGTNDLTQYTMAMDRTHPALAAKADGLHPAVLRLIARTVEGAHGAGRWVGVCGELAADPVAVPILIGLGVDELSVSVPAIPTVKAQIRSLSLAECQERARQALACATARQVREGVQSVHEHAV
ncbi:MAG TPA: phosphoenolpyruvate--protein phosphotransferase [Roseiflexaceae bacterium]|nr:phosphoenolpyruvate--protein phosphotransferase [Roseiflexaceae bacterium]